MNSRYEFKVCYLHILFSIDDLLNQVRKEGYLAGAKLI
jgi:hypothetical protein